MTKAELDKDELRALKDALLKSDLPKELLEKANRILDAGEHTKKVGRPSKHPLRSVDAFRALMVMVFEEFEPKMNQGERMDLIIQISTNLKKTLSNNQHLNEAAANTNIPVGKLTSLIESLIRAFPDRDLQSSISRGRAILSEFDAQPNLRKKQD